MSSISFLVHEVEQTSVHQQCSWHLHYSIMQPTSEKVGSNVVPITTVLPMSQSPPSEL